MEQKRRTITTADRVSKKKDMRKIWTVIGAILGFIVIFGLSFGIAYGVFTSDGSEDTPKTDVSSSTEEDIANMSRADLEENYLKLKKQLEEKDDEIKMLKQRLDKHEETSAEAAPPTATTPDNDESTSNTTDGNSNGTSAENNNTGNSGEYAETEQPAQTTPAEPELQNNEITTGEEFPEVTAGAE